MGNFYFFAHIFLQSGDYEIEVGGIRFPADVRLNSPILPSHLGKTTTMAARDSGREDVPTRYADKSSSFDYDDSDDHI